MDSSSQRASELAGQWRVSIDRTVDTPTSLVAFGTRDDERVVMKVVKVAGEEWNSGAVAAAFDGNGVVRVYESAPGAALLEELNPATPLVDVVNAGHDDLATRILAHVIRDMTRSTPSVAGHATAENWGRGFAWYVGSGDQTIPHALVADAADRYVGLCATQSNVRLLHGDLQHYNVLRDEVRGWVAIDPKGVVAEIEFELGAALRNPHGRPDLLNTASVARRIDTFAEILNVNAKRVAEWAYAQAVLSAVWTVEDGYVLEADNPALQLNAALRPLIHKDQT